MEDLRTQGASARLRAEAMRMLHPERDARTLRLNGDTGLIKVVACLCMLSDHLGKMIFPNALYISVSGSWAFLLPSGSLLRIIGRLAMPMFCYCIAVGCAYSRNVWKYALRLLLMGVLVHPLYMAAMGHVKLGTFDWAHNFWKLGEIYDFYYARKLNIFFTLAMGTLLLASVRARTYVLTTLFAVLTWRLSGRIDYGWKGVALICLFYAFLDRPAASLAAVAAFMWYWAMPGFFTAGKTQTNLQWYALAALPLIYLPLPRRLKLPKWVFYGFYPAHLLVIYCLQL
ncbi:MAG: TraX family protein [Clostridia bacterium]|nr:TraX family protein [Clostridia bacterium]